MTETEAPEVRNIHEPWGMSQRLCRIHDTIRPEAEEFPQVALAAAQERE